MSTVLSSGSAILKAIRSIGRSSRLHREGFRFESGIAYSYQAPMVGRSICNRDYAGFDSQGRISRANRLIEQIAGLLNLKFGV